MRLQLFLCSVFLLAGVEGCGCSGTLQEQPSSEPRAVRGPPKPAALDSPPPPAQLARTAAAPVKPQPMLWLQPGDLSTAVGDTPIRAWIDNLGAPVGAEVLRDVASRLELRQYPSLLSVPFEVVTYDPPVVTAPPDPTTKGVDVQRQDPGERRAYVELRPLTPLTDSWYVVALKSKPESVGLAPWSAPKPPVGTYAARFARGSAPVLSRLLLCNKGDRLRGIFEFSENIQTPVGRVESHVRIENPRTGAACAHASSGPVPNTSMKWVDQDCTGFSPTETLRIIINPGLTSTQGRPVTMLGGGTSSLRQDVVLHQLPDSEQGCKVWRP
jgi:hypothetical protein